MQVKLRDGKTVEVRTAFSLTEQYLNENLTPAQTEKVTGAPAKAVIGLARQIAKNPEKTLFAVGMGPNQFFNADLKDRAIMLVAALTRNLGFPGGNVGSYAGNYRTALFNGMPTFAVEDPFNLQLDPAGQGQGQEVPALRVAALLQLRRSAPAGGQPQLHRTRDTCPCRRRRCG
jgi:nitrate reductase alpha subunit